MNRRVYEIVADVDNSYWMLLEDGIGMAKSKSRNALKRIREALVAVEGAGLVGLTVEEIAVRNDHNYTGISTNDNVRGVVQAISGNDLIVRLTDDKLDSWNVRDCRLVEPEKIDTPTPWNDPSIGIYPAVDLLKRVLACGIDTSGHELEAVAEDIREFLKARDAAQPT